MAIQNDIKNNALPTNVMKFPVIEGVEITEDEHGRINLNSLHKASKCSYNKRPNEWIRQNCAKELADQLITGIPAINYAPIHAKRGRNGSTFAHRLLAVSYAGWLSPSFQLKVNQAFLNFYADAPLKSKLPDIFEDFIEHQSVAAACLARDKCRTKLIEHAKDALSRRVTEDEAFKLFKSWNNQAKPLVLLRCDTQATEIYTELLTKSLNEIQAQLIEVRA